MIKFELYSVFFLSYLTYAVAQNNFRFTDGFLQPPPFQGGEASFRPSPRENFIPPHRAVLAAQEEEANLPPHFLNGFYKNPRLRQELARHSWIGPGEQPVYSREAEKISRKSIYNVLNHAGFVRSNQV